MRTFFGVALCCLGATALAGESRTWLPDPNAVDCHRLHVKLAGHRSKSVDHETVLATQWGAIEAPYEKLGISPASREGMKARDRALPAGHVGYLVETRAGDPIRDPSLVTSWMRYVANVPVLDLMSTASKRRYFGKNQIAESPPLPEKGKDGVLDVEKNYPSLSKEFEKRFPLRIELGRLSADPSLPPGYLRSRFLGLLNFLFHGPDHLLDNAPLDKLWIVLDSPRKNSPLYLDCGFKATEWSFPDPEMGEMQVLYARASDVVAFLKKIYHPLEADGELRVSDTTPALQEKLARIAAVRAGLPDKLREKGAGAYEASEFNLHVRLGQLPEARAALEALARYWPNERVTAASQLYLELLTLFDPASGNGSREAALKFLSDRRNAELVQGAGNYYAQHYFPSDASYYRALLLLEGKGNAQLKSHLQTVAGERRRQGIPVSKGETLDQEFQRVLQDPAQVSGLIDESTATVDSEVGLRVAARLVATPPYGMSAGARVFYARMLAAESARLGKAELSREAARQMGLAGKILAVQGETRRLAELERWRPRHQGQYSLPEKALRAFQSEVIARAAEHFPGRASNMRAFFEELASTVPQAARAEYLREIRKLSIYAGPFAAAREQLGSADIVQRAFVLYGRSLGHEVEGRVTPADFLRWGMKVGQAYSIPDEELTKFRKEIVSRAGELFPGRRNRTATFFLELANRLPAEKRDAYRQAIRDLKIGEQSFGNAMKYPGPLDTIHRAFAIYAQHRGETVPPRITLADLMRWDVPVGEPYSIPKAELEAFRKEIIEHGARLFPGYSNKAKDYFQQLAELLPESKRAAYRAELEKLGLYAAAIRAGKVQPKSADLVHRAFVLFSHHKGQPIEGRVTVAKLKALGVPLEAKTARTATVSSRNADLEVDAEALNRFRSDILKRAPELFPRYATFADRFFVDLAQKLPVEKRPAYLAELAMIPLAEKAFRTGLESEGPAAAAYRAFQLFAKHAGEGEAAPVTVRALKSWGVPVGQKYSLPDAELKKFRADVLKHARQLFPGYSLRAVDYFESLAERLPEEKRTDYRRELAAIRLSQAAFHNGLKADGPLDDVHRALALFARYAGIETGARITRAELLGWDAPIAQKYSLPNGELTKFNREIARETATLFPNVGNKTDVFFQGLAENLLPEKRADYLAELASLGIYPSLFQKAREGLKSVDLLHRAFAVYAKHSGQPVKQRITVADLKAWGLPIGQRFSLPDGELEKFQREVADHAARFFPGYQGKSAEYFQSLTEKLPPESRAAYLEELAQLKLGTSALHRARSQPKAADDIHQALALFARYSGRPITGRIGENELKELGLGADLPPMPSKAELLKIVKELKRLGCPLNYRLKDPEFAHLVRQVTALPPGLLVQQGSRGYGSWGKLLKAAEVDPLEGRAARKLGPEEEATLAELKYLQQHGVSLVSHRFLSLQHRQQINQLLNGPAISSANLFDSETTPRLSHSKHRHTDVVRLYDDAVRLFGSFADARELLDK